MKLEPISDEQLIESLRQDILEQADQIGGLTSELEREKQSLIIHAHNWNLMFDALNRENDRLLEQAETAEQQLAASQAETATLKMEHLWAKRLINCWWAAEQSLFNDVANPEGFEQLENKTAVAIERWKKATKTADDALTSPSAAAERVQALDATIRECLEGIIENRIADGGVCVRRVADCDCSECLARTALAALDAATARNPRIVEEVKGDG